MKYDGPFKNRHRCDGPITFCDDLGHRSTVTIVKSLISGVRIYHDRLAGHICASRNHIFLACSQVKIEHEGVDECGLDKFDWKYRRRFGAINQQRKREHGGRRTQINQRADGRRA